MQTGRCCCYAKMTLIFIFKGVKYNIICNVYIYTHACKHVHVAINCVSAIYTCMWIYAQETKPIVWFQTEYIL